MMENSTSKNFTITVVGDGAVGKTALITAFIEGKFCQDYLPTIIDLKTTVLVYKDQKYLLTIKDTVGQEDYKALRALNYDDTDCLVMCFSTTKLNSMTNIKKSWIQEINANLPNTPIVLVGTQVDSRTEAMAVVPKSYVTKDEGERLRQAIGAYKYIECSALTSFNIVHVFESCIDAYIENEASKNKKSFLKKFSCFGKDSSSD